MPFEPFFLSGAPPPPNSDSRLVWPLSRSRCASAARSVAMSIAQKKRARETPLFCATPSNAPALTSASSTLRLTLRPSTRLQKSKIERNGPPSSRAILDDVDRALAHALDGAEAEADDLLLLVLLLLLRLLDDREVLVRLVDVGAQDGDAGRLRLGDELHDGVGVVLVAREERRVELDGEVALEVRRLVREQPVRRRVRAVEAVARELLHEVEDALGDLRVDLLHLRAVEEGGLLLGHRLGLLLAHGAAEQVRLAERVAGERGGDLHDLLLVDDDAVGVLEDGLERRVVVLDALAAVLALDEVVDHAALERARAVERARGDDVLEAVGLELLEQLAEAAGLELEHAGDVGRGDHLVDARVVERDEREVERPPRRRPPSPC